ncbi:hypothetical protein EX895_006481 [Sporisorium graminicola]|uniref:BZIP domain-containing protein n=1 Tax=Sporisorium graminicola TaxID=280036 RepID=A0A4V6ETC4_9BASI|nr:hypothetical protein EX895_006481 [Sporisorium graminicola]TKY84579.1 hypothetical protein EX895_006481 [Sporisorium graminicola]
MTNTTSASTLSVSPSMSTSPSAAASSSRLPETPVKNEALNALLTDSASSSNKKRKITEDDDEDTDDEDCDESSTSAASPSKPSHTGGRKRASDEERKARLEARQARNRLSAQYSRERKKAYVEQLEGSLNSLNAENTLLRQQRQDEQALRQALEAKLKDSQLRVTTLETILRTVAPSLIPLLGSLSSSSSSSSLSLPSSSSSAFAASSTSTLAPQFDAGLSANLASALVQNNGLASKEVSLPPAIAAPASTASSSLSLDTLSQQSSNEDFDGVAGEQGGLARVGSNVDVNGSSIVNQGYPFASQISVPTPEQPSSIAASTHISASQHPVEAKAAAGGAREAEALLSNFIDLDAKFAHGDATSAPQDQGASTSPASAQPVPLGEDHAATATGASRSASASAGDFASLSTALAGSGEGANGSSSENSKSNNIKNGDSTIFSTISLSHADTKEQDPQARFQLLNSPLVPTERNVWELATDAMLQDIYGNKDDIAAVADNADSSVASMSDASSSEVDVPSTGSSPFDLVDLDIEIEEPMQFNIGLGDDDTCHQKADATTLDWPGLMASLVA